MKFNPRRFNFKSVRLEAENKRSAFEILPQAKDPEGARWGEVHASISYFMRRSGLNARKSKLNQMMPESVCFGGFIKSNGA